MRIYSEMRDGVVVGGMNIDVDGRDSLWCKCMKMNGSCVCFRVPCRLPDTV